jgi:hypothetical protein
MSFLRTVKDTLPIVRAIGKEVLREGIDQVGKGKDPLPDLRSIPQKSGRSNVDLEKVLKRLGEVIEEQTL